MSMAAVDCAMTACHCLLQDIKQLLTLLNSFCDMFYIDGVYY